MEFSPPIPKQHVGRTFAIAISLLGVLTLAQFGAATWALAARYRAALAAAAAQEPPLPISAVPQKISLPPAGLAIADPFQTSDADVEAHAELAALPQPTPVPVPPVARRSDSRSEELATQARALRERGDTSAALTKFLEAQTLAPNNPALIAETASTYEKMSLPDKAAEHWRRLYEMGESAGIFYTAAEAKIHAPVAGAAPAVPGGFQPGSTLALAEITQEDQTTSPAQKQFVLRVPLKARPGTEINVKDVVIQVFFYDRLGDGSIVQTNANVGSHWVTLPADWADSEIEVLEVEYHQPPPVEGEDRKFHGYVVRIYYRRELQDMRAEPVDLLKKYPPPLSIESE